MSDPVARAVERVARESYGRLLAWLASRCGDLLLAEDALADALERALTTWPRTGVPDRPEAWLLTTARRRVIDRVRRDDTRTRAADQLRRDAEEAVDTPFREGLPDRRLELLFLCAHPEVPERDRTALVLQTVLGLDAKRIGSAFLVPPSTMAQRLVRVKRRLHGLGLEPELPPPEALDERLPHVLEAIYTAYGTGWDGALDTEARGLAEEALWLARLVADARPEQAEAAGLLALIAYSLARRDARRTADGAFVPLEEQDTSRWDEALLQEGDRALHQAAQHGSLGRFQLEAAIQAVHAARARVGQTNWWDLHGVYTLLVQHHPSVGAAVGYAATFGRLGHPEEGLGVLDQIDSERVRRHQPWWAVRAHLLDQAGRTEDAHEAWTRAAGLTEDAAVRSWLLARRDRSGGDDT